MLKRPEKIHGEITGAILRHSISRTVDDEIVKKTTCLGAVAVERAVRHYFKNEVTPHYSGNLVRLDVGGVKYFYTKGVAAMQIDTPFDEAFRDALQEFGHPSKWSVIKSQIEGFLLDRLLPLVGKRFTLTIRGAKGRKDKGKVSGKKHLGGSCETRTKRIRRMLENASVCPGALSIVNDRF